MVTVQVPGFRVQEGPRPAGARDLRIPRFAAVSVSPGLFSGLWPRQKRKQNSKRFSGRARYCRLAWCLRSRPVEVGNAWPYSMPREPSGLLNYGGCEPSAGKGATGGQDADGNGGKRDAAVRGAHRADDNLVP